MLGLFSVMKRGGGLLVALGLATALATPGLAGEVALVDGVPHVKNGAEPSGGVETLKLEELWRAGGEDDEIFFGFVTRVLGDDEGNVYLMDQQLAEVHVYSPDGEHVGTLGRQGQGPGETQSPGDMFFTPDGKLAMVQTFPGSIVLVDLEGNPAGKLSFGSGDPSQGSFGVLVRGLSRAGNIVLGGIDMTFNQGKSNQTYYLAVCDEKGVEKQRCVTKEHPIDYANFILDERAMDFPWSRVDIGPDGRVYIGEGRNDYAIKVFSKDGKLERVIERQYESWKREPSQSAAAKRVLDGVAAYYPQPPREMNVEDLEVDIMNLSVDDDGMLWVRTSRGDYGSDAALTTADVFDPEGNFVKQVEIIAPGDAEQDAIYILNKGRVVVVTGALDAFATMQGVTSEEEQEEAEPLEVICYTMKGFTAKG